MVKYLPLFLEGFPAAILGLLSKLELGVYLVT